MPINAVSFAHNVAPGSMVWFTACWFNPRMQNGRPTKAISTRLQGGGVANTTTRLAA